MRFHLFSLMFSISLLVLAIACDQEKGPMVEKHKLDPVEAATMEFLDAVKAKKWDNAYAMLTAKTREAWPKEEFIKETKFQITPKIGSLHIRRIEKKAETATLYTDLIGDWAHLNTVESQRVTLQWRKENDKWLIEKPEMIAKLEEQRALDAARKARADKWRDKLVWSDFKVRSELTEEGPALVFTGNVKNAGASALEMAQVFTYFFNADNEKVYSVVVVPVYISRWDPKKAKPLMPGESREFIETILSEIPDDWSGEFKYELWDAGDMPNKR